MRPRLPYNFRHLARISFQNIGRNLLLSVATAVMMGLILFIFNVVMVLNILTQSSIDKLGEKVDLIVYLSDDISTLEINEIQNDLETLPVVIETEYTSKEQALSGFLSSYPEKSDPFTQYGIENPLPANIRIMTEKPEHQELIINYLRESSYNDLLVDIESSDENQEIVSRLVSVTNFAKNLIIGVIITFVFGSLLIIINAIHLSIFTRKTEIQIMQLVGAKPSMIRFPFVFEGMIYSIIAVLFSFALLLIFLKGSQLTTLDSFNESFDPLKLFLFELAGSLFIGILSSLIALNYYLKKTLILEHS